MIRLAPALAALCLAACTDAAQTFDTAVVAPVSGAISGIGNAATDVDRRAAVELIVKAEHPALLQDIAAGGGPVLTRAFDAAGVPEEDRPTRRFQLNRDLGLYTDNPGALVLALSVYGRQMS